MTRLEPAPGSSSAQKGSCRRGRRWCTPSPSTRSTSLIAGPRASSPCSVGTRERSSLKCGTRSTPKSRSGGRRVRRRSLLVCCSLTRSTCWTLSVSLSSTELWRMIWLLLLLWPPTEVIALQNANTALLSDHKNLYPLIGSK